MQQMISYDKELNCGISNICLGILFLILHKNTRKYMFFSLKIHEYKTLYIMIEVP